MKKHLKPVLFILLLITSVFMYFWPYLKMEFTANAHYTEQDTKEYLFYTPDILKKMPRISTRYDFDFANIMGPAAHVWALTFYNIQDTSKIEVYLTAEGYQLQDSCDIEAKCWRSVNSRDVVTVGTFSQDKSVLVQVIRTFN